MQLRAVQHILRIRNLGRSHHGCSRSCSRSGWQATGSHDRTIEGPRAGEVLIEVKATGICHTDDFTLSGADPEGLFPAFLGHEGAGIVVDVGPGVTSVKKGRSRYSALHAGMPRMLFLPVSQENLCTAIRSTQGQGLMPDGTSRFSIGKDKIHHYMGCSTFANYTVLPEIAVAKVNPKLPLTRSATLVAVSPQASAQSSTLPRWRWAPRQSSSASAALA